jgi:hypothetical protein
MHGKAEGIYLTPCLYSVFMIYHVWHARCSDSKADRALRFKHVLCPVRK